MARHVFRCPVRWADMDAYGHVNNVAFLRYLEEARIDFMFRLAPGEGSASFRGGSVVARHEIDYLRAARPGDTVCARTWIGQAQAIRYERHTEIVLEDGTTLARARTLWCPVDTATGRPRRVPAEVRATFAAPGGGEG